MASQAELVKALLSELALDVKSYQQLARQLQHQETLLVNRDSQALLTHNAQLQQLMKQLGDHAQRRCEYLESLGVSADDTGMKRLLAALPAQYQQQGNVLWQQLYELTLQCQERNNCNGRLLAQQKQMIDKLLKPEQQYCYSPGC
ncbi:flagellar protein FlgN [Photobacterium chitinilyticum]|uniref:Flagellar protein FlgN n=1 Tax=Photobacterium chitinilyticum TaxID=2485123 RepID=A0A3S3QZ27_9GAMM|nr:flagellar protein FlgN [Photobacterium chitinilyticum]RWX53769.1 flagellar protein FlgN [Photobacterium chitinilyticum]